MSGINKVILIGHLASEPESVIVHNTPMLNFTIATPQYFAKNGTSNEAPELHQIIMLRGLADIAARLLKKGKLVYLEGKVRPHLYEDNAGGKRYTTEIVADNFKLLGRSSDFD